MSRLQHSVGRLHGHGFGPLREAMCCMILDSRV
jgi:hypothetical protein